MQDLPQHTSRGGGALCFRTAVGRHGLARPPARVPAADNRHPRRRGPPPPSLGDRAATRAWSAWRTGRPGRCGEPDRAAQADGGRGPGALRLQREERDYRPTPAAAARAQTISVSACRRAEPARPCSPGTSTRSVYARLGRQAALPVV
jgi:hypothetical protein